MPIKCVISVPLKTITGVFNIRFALARPIETLDASNIGIKTLVGDTVGLEYEIRGKGRNWYIASTRYPITVSDVVKYH